MQLSQITDYLKKCIKLCDEVSEMSGNLRIYTYYDYLKSAIVHGCLIRQYRYASFYRMKGCDRRDTITYRRMLDIYNKCNDNIYIYIYIER